MSIFVRCPQGGSAGNPLPTMMSRKKTEQNPGQMASEPDSGIWRGRAIAVRFVSPDGMTILVGQNARDNDLLTLRLARPGDFWFHIASGPGSHVVVRNQEGLARLPRSTRNLAASLAARFSKARRGGRVAVHLARCKDVRKPRGYAPGKVVLKRFETVHAAPLDEARLEELRKAGC